MQLFDSHCHFDFAAFDHDRAALWKRCKQAGITGLLMPGVYPAQWSIAATLCAQFSGLKYAAGIHPHWIAQQPWFSPSRARLDEATEKQIIRLLGDELTRSDSVGNMCIAVGECGLDRSINIPLLLQQQILGLHIDIANQLHKPLIIHSVKAHNEMLAYFKRHPPHYGGVIHGFSGSLATAQQFIARGFLLGVGGTITYERAQKTRAALAAVPLHAVLLETDAPDMPVSGKQGARNSPEYLPLIAQCYADLRGLSIEHVAQASQQNAQQLFGVG